VVASNFDKSLALVLKSEGGNDDDPADHGGRTSRGITQREYDAWCVEHDRPSGDVWRAPQADIAAIYHDEYWNPWCDSIPVGTDYLYFDMAVNSGPHQATLLLQRALDVKDDGRIGAVTRAAIASADAHKLIDEFTAQKTIFYRLISKKPNQAKFLKGWLNRTASVRAAAQAMIH
jgi:lysozyme family protein